MADDKQGTSGGVPGLAQEFLAQIRGITDSLESLAGFGAHLPMVPGSLPLPGTLSAAQLTSITDSIAAQRRSIGALKAQLSSFEEQLAVLEQILGPLVQLTSKWAEIEERLLSIRRGAKPEGRP